MTEKYGKEVKFRGPRKIKPPDEIQSFLFRAIRELLINSVKHSGTKKINVEITKSRDNLSASIKDNGKGFETDTLENTTGLGLFSIRERLDALGGSFRIDSSPKKGTLVSMQIPLHDQLRESHFS